jgi:lipopolysaccharide transport system permease protein
MKEMKVVYTPDSQMRSPVLLLRSMWQGVLDSRELAWRLFIRDFYAKYRKSLLGILWAFLTPLVTGLVFIFLQGRGVVRFGDTGIPYPVYVLTGTILWQLFTESLNAPLATVRTSSHMITKVNFPREALIISSFYQVMLNLLIKVLILAGTFLYFGIPLTREVALAAGAVLVLILLGMSIGLFLTPIGLLYSDVTSSLVIVTQVWFFLTPVVYPSPKNFPFNVVANLNPVTPVLTTARDLMTIGTVKNPEAFFVVTALALLGMFVSWVIYRLAVPIILERMSA